MLTAAIVIVLGLILVRFPRQTLSPFGVAVVAAAGLAGCAAAPPPPPPVPDPGASRSADLRAQAAQAERQSPEVQRQDAAAVRGNAKALRARCDAALAARGALPAVGAAETIAEAAAAIEAALAWRHRPLECAVGDALRGVAAGRGVAVRSRAEREAAVRSRAEREAVEARVKALAEDCLARWPRGGRRLTAADYADLRVGLHVWTVACLLGEPGEASLEPGTGRTEVRSWANPDGGALTATFVYGRLRAKAQAGLE